MSLLTVPFTALAIDDERSFSHVELYAELKALLVHDEASFFVCDGSPGDAALLNLAFWDATGHAEVLSEPRLTADMVAHNAWHHAARRGLGAEATTIDGILFAEAVASAFDVYLVGRLLGHAPSSQFLDTQVVAMSEAADDAGLSEAGFEALLEGFSARPEASFESMRQVLFDTARELVDCTDLSGAAAVLARGGGHPLWPLFHHFELPGWVLFAKCHSTGRRCEAVVALDRALREADDAVELLRTRWVCPPRPA